MSNRFDEARIDEPIAIVGLGCRFPGGVQDAESFWWLLRDGEDAITEVPRERWDVDDFYDPSLGEPGKMCTRWGGFLAKIDHFDPGFFGISAREAASMDPQQRLLLEVAWHALEDAGIAADRLAATRTGVFIGTFLGDYQRQAGPAPSRACTGIANNFLANRLSYFFGFRGPSLTVDTACSSSLVAVDLACQSLRLRTSDACLAGGVNLILSPGPTVSFSEAGMMAADGRCKAFDARADGYVRSEGCGIVLLKRLADALRDGDPIWATIRSSAVNHNGRAGALTAPHAPAQIEVIREALTRAGLTARSVDYLEAHGTGTPLGDTTELQVISEVYGRDRLDGQPIRVGSVKTNIGHPEAAAGIAGLIKTALCLTNGEIPSHLHCDAQGPDDGLAAQGVEIPTAAMSWPPGRPPRFAAVSSFGYGGTNAHLILEGAPPVTAGAATGDRPLHVLTLSARDEAALRELSHRFARRLDRPADDRLADICYSANTGRSCFAHRLAVVAGSVEELHGELEAFATGRPSAGAHYGVARRVAPRLVFLFSDGAAPPASALEQLSAAEPTFGGVFSDWLTASGRHSGASGAPSDREDTLGGFAAQLAVAALWRSWGVEPTYAVGTGAGKIAAACLSGRLDRREAIRLLEGVAGRAGDRRAPSSRPEPARRSDPIQSLAGAVHDRFGGPVRPGGSRPCSESAGPGGVSDSQRPAWAEHAREEECLAELPEDVLGSISSGGAIVLEMGPSSRPSGLEVRPEQVCTRLSSLGCDGPPWGSLLGALSSLYLSGVQIDWAGFDREHPRRRVRLPGYPFAAGRDWRSLPPIEEP